MEVALWISKPTFSATGSPNGFVCNVASHRLRKRRQLTTCAFCRPSKGIQFAPGPRSQALGAKPADPRGEFITCFGGSCLGGCVCFMGWRIASRPAPDGRFRSGLGFPSEPECAALHWPDMHRKHSAVRPGAGLAVRPGESE